MINPNTLFIIQHALGCTLLGGMYTVQIKHIEHIFGLYTGSLFYLFGVLVFYTVLYGYEARLICFESIEKARLLKFFRSSLFAFNILLSFLEYLDPSTPKQDSSVVLAVQGIFSFFSVIFTELLLSLILGIKINGKDK